MIVIEYALKLTGNVSTNGAISISGEIKQDSGVELNGEVICSTTRSFPYPGPYVVTPSKETQILNTANKNLDSDITINPIPDVYIDTTITEYGAGAGQILNGYKGYVNGELITGTAVLATASVSGTTLILTDGFPVSV